MAAGTERLPPVSKDAYAGWWDYAYKHGADVASLCEAIGLTFAALADMPLSALPPQLRRTTLEAQQIKRQRASRKKS